MSSLRRVFFYSCNFISKKEKKFLKFTNISHIFLEKVITLKYNNDADRNIYKKSIEKKR